ncbi:unnamed protein product [Cyprideis torosa]|uniref:Uncharacterized protein n=1 Tax=Cyprideis torosa TaxID=163714 RepID=A0A7R8WXW2_9CRUS|nr:unnamed protein product [Cyprideis torosa]CAG0908199.1 unnamed protein product [Cyprideis torosa]
MLRTGNLDASVAFYTQLLGFTEVRRGEYPDGEFTLVFLQASGDSGQQAPMIELTYNWGKDKYELGSGYGHVAYRVESLAAIGEKLEAAGGKFSWGPGDTPDGKKGMAFLKDPDGYEIELIEYR